MLELTSFVTVLVYHTRKTATQEKLKMPTKHQSKIKTQNTRNQGTPKMHHQKHRTTKKPQRRTQITKIT